MSNSKFLITVAMAFGVAGCNSMGTSNTSMYSIHQPVVQRTNYALDVSTGSGGLTDSERVRTAQWFEALDLRYGDRVAIDYGDNYFDPAVRNDVGQLAAEHGILVEDKAPITQGAVVPGTARVVVSRSSASVPSCPDWSTNSDANYNSSNHSNHGCSINSNLAAMIADPEDLVRGREKTSLDDASGTAAINALRTKQKGDN